jgi:hypothetical protein
MYRHLAPTNPHLTTGQAIGPAPVAEPAATQDAVGVLSDVLERDGQQLSATQTWQQALADADRLSMWMSFVRVTAPQRWSPPYYCAGPRCAASF